MSATVVELAAFLGFSPSRVRHIIAEHHIRPTGHRWKAKLYPAREVIQHAGAHDRLVKTA